MIDVSKITTVLKEAVSKDEYVYVGMGMERRIGVSRTKFKEALVQLKEEGYVVHYVPLDPPIVEDRTSMMVLSKPKNSETAYIDVCTNKEKIASQMIDIRTTGKRSETQLAESLGMSVTAFRANRTLLQDEHIVKLINKAGELRDKGYSNVEISDIMGMSESTVRSLIRNNMNMRKVGK